MTGDKIYACSNLSPATYHPLLFLCVIRFPLSLQISRVGGALTHQTQVRQGRPDLSDLIDLLPGEYVLREANHPEWICRITILSK